MCVRRRQGLDSLCDRQQRDRKPSPRGSRRNRGGSGSDRQGNEQQVQGNQRSWPGSFGSALLIEKWVRSYWKLGATRFMMLANCVSIKLRVTLVLTALTFFSSSANGQSTPAKAVNSDKPTVAAQGPRPVNQ